MNQQAVDIVMSAWRDRSARQVQAYSELQELRGNPILKTPKGREVYERKVGDMIHSRNFRDGAPAVKVMAREKVNGYSRYYAGGLWHRNCDILEG